MSESFYSVRRVPEQNKLFTQKKNQQQGFEVNFVLDICVYLAFNEVNKISIIGASSVEKLRSHSNTMSFEEQNLSTELEMKTKPEDIKC